MSSNKPIRWVDSFSLATYSTIVSIIIAYFLYAGTAQIAIDMQNTFLVYAESNDWFIFYAVMFGFLITSLIQGLVLILSERARVNMRVSLMAILLSFFINFIFWILMAYFFLFLLYPEIFEGLSFWEIFIILPRTLAYFSVLILGYPVVFWMVSIVTYGIIFMVTLKLLSNYKYEKLPKISSYKTIY